MAYCVAPLRCFAKGGIDAACGLALLVLVGCSGSGLRTYPVQGNIELTDGDAKVLVGSIVEFMQNKDPLVRASGKIKSGGSFTMETLHQGQVIPGVPKGSYKARIILYDEDEANVPKRKGDPLDKRFLDFNTSGLSFTVPGENFTLKLSRS